MSNKPKWKKRFFKIPKKIRADLQNIKDNDVKVLAAKTVKRSDLESGLFAHLGLDIDLVKAGQSWEVMPSDTFGTISNRNQLGWFTTRRDLPKYTKYFYHDIQNFGDGSTYGWSTVAIPREVYERDETPPYLFHLEIKIENINADGSVDLICSVDEIFDKASTHFEEDLLFAINLLQENFGDVGVIGSTSPTPVFSSHLDWDVFPPGNIDEVIQRISSTDKIHIDPDLELIKDRLDLFQQFEPQQFLRGLGGNAHYIGAKFSDDLVVFENIKYGNALYILYEDWEELSKQPRSDLLRKKTSQFDRIIHTHGWKNRFAVLMQKELTDRGIRIKIGRNRRRQ